MDGYTGPHISNYDAISSQIRRNGPPVLRGLRFAFVAAIALATSGASAFSQGAKDPGVDIATVVRGAVNLRSEPSASASIVREIRRGELLVLLSREDVEGWYNVIHVDSADEGWIRGDLLEIQYTRAPRRESPFQEERVDSYSNPTVVVANDSYLDLNLRVGSQQYTVPSNSTKTITLSPGTYDYIGSARGVIPAIGTKTWEVGHRYTWRFRIVTTRR